MGAVVRQALAGFAGVFRLSSGFALAAITAAALMLAAAPPASANSKYAGIVLDAKTGKVLYEDSADAPRYPASLTKMMTLYLVFEALESGRISKNSRITFSRNAAAEPPTKLGVPAGQSIVVEQAIHALVTRSANDVSTAVAEFIGGSEAKFAAMMTNKARQLGMSSTTFKNAHGLPNSAQKTTARDMARLGIALREHFPQYYSYFSTRSFTYGGRRINTHNNLLGRVTGVDGIKTGYIRASGFNLVSSVSTGGKSIVAVVMGGRTARSRDAHMVNLIQRTLPKASTGGDKILIARGAATQTVAAAMLPRSAPVPADRPEEVPVTAYAEEQGSAAGATAFAEAAAPRPQAELDPVSTASTAMEGWVIQVASMPSEDEAKRRLAETSQHAPTVLANVTPFTEVFQMDGRTYYRARFGGFQGKSDAWRACETLKKKNVACYAVEN
ncbi:D-alanyl-D-alanine carboxypeptidase [Chelativorans salis]|uniref:D-alanyl-D-alanine carboxypeptidase n=1 Tax=Chelativorans salis TaxID=2978478 RepID=A0ABT2LPS6_9HYPH|nr:D-alanyl-D-alanine carboxypeptidase [Chelativorans sp. EGI FJ00035]MCT7375658.1 D-alanyl-D-alanine carboxypeptidase [Chelativorans sp. EGI FJ00035]